MSSTDLTCQFCRKDYSSKSKLLYHQKTTKKCLKIQEDQGIITNRLIFTCENCNKTYTIKQSLEYHLENTCKTIKNNENKEIKEKLKELENKILSSSSSSQNGNTSGNIIGATINGGTQIIVNNIGFMEYMTPERINNVFGENYTIQTLMGGETALADFTIEYFLKGQDKPVYLVSDKSRNSFYFLDSEKKRIDDSDGKIIRSLIWSYGFSAIRGIYNDHVNRVAVNTDGAATFSSINHHYNNIKNLHRDGNGKDYTQCLVKKLPKTLTEKEMMENLEKAKMELIEKIRLEDEVEEKKLKELTQQKKEKIQEEEKTIELLPNGLDPREEELFDKDGGMLKIGGISRGTLKVYKRSYMDTGVPRFPPNFKETPESREKYLKYLNSTFLSV